MLLLVHYVAQQVLESNLGKDPFSLAPTRIKTWELGGMLPYWAIIQCSNGLYARFQTATDNGLTPTESIWQRLRLSPVHCHPPYLRRPTLRTHALASGEATPFVASLTMIDSSLLRAANRYAYTDDGSTVYSVETV